jgi:Holliday junction resolvase
MNSRSKGQRGEREIAALLKLYGFRARRGSQSSFVSDDPDVICPELSALGYRIEVKMYSEFKLDSPTVRETWRTKALADLAKSGSPNDRVALFHRAKRREWMVWVINDDVIYYANHWLKVRQEEWSAL